METGGGPVERLERLEMLEILLLLLKKISIIERYCGQGLPIDTVVLARGCK